MIQHLQRVIDYLFWPLRELKKTKLKKKDHRDSFSRYYVPNVKIKYFNVLIDGKSFFVLPVKNEVKVYEKIIEMSRNNDYTTGNLLEIAYFKENYRLIAIDLSKKLVLLVTWKPSSWSNNVFHHWKIKKNYFWIFAKFCKNLIKMEIQKIVNLLISSENEYSKFAPKNWYVIGSETKGGYWHENQTKFLTSSIESRLCDYSDADVLVKGNINVVEANYNTKMAFKNCAPFRKCRTDINKTFWAEHINTAMPMYNFIE